MRGIYLIFSFALDLVRPIALSNKTNAVERFMKLKKIKLPDSNEVMPLVEGCDGSPVLRINNFALGVLKNKAAQSIENDVRAVMHLEKWSSKTGTSWREELSSTKAFPPTRFTSLVNHLTYKSQDNNNDVTPILPEPVGQSYFNHRLTTAAEYLEFIHESVMSTRRHDDPETQALIKKFEKLKNKLLDRVISGKAPSTVRGLNNLQYDSLVEALEREDILPWRGVTQVRNKALVQCLVELGPRAGEILGLTIGNCHLEGQKPFIVLEQNVKYPDPRTDVPQVKTKSRALPISQKLAACIKAYLSVRATTKEAKRQPPFLFLSSRAPYYPLAYSSLENVIADLRRSVPGLEGLHAHRLRHTRFERLDLYMQKKNYSDTQKTKIKNAIGGWSPNSRTSENYEKNATDKQVYEVLESVFAAEREQW